MKVQVDKSATGRDKIVLDAPIFDPQAYRLSDDQAAIIAQARELGQTVFAARAAAYDRDATFPTENYKDLHRRGLLGISIPKNHWDHFAVNLPQAEVIPVTKEFIAMRLLKSAAAIQFLERSAELGDIGIRAMQERVKPGITEGEVFGLVHEAVMKAGGEMGMIQLGSCSMLDPDINDQRPRPVERIIGDRDVINNELGIFYNGYEAQCGRPVFTGEPTAEYREIFEIAKEGCQRLVPTLHAGKSSEDSIRAMQFIRDTGYEFYGGFLQGMLGANSRHEPQIGFDRVQSAEDRYLFAADGRLVYEVGHVFTLQMHIVDRKHTRGLFVADFFAIEENGPRCLNKLPLEMMRTLS